MKDVSTCDLTDIEINTVDSYQGREKDIMIFNCVRNNKITHERGSLGFVTDPRRLNVAITRPKHFLFIVGNRPTLSKDLTWKTLIDSMASKQQHGCYFKITR